MAASGADSGDWGDDVFSMLVRANELEKSPKLQLSDHELVSHDSLQRQHFLTDDPQIGNFFVMILAGYETTANTLAACLALLALHEEIQEEVVEEIFSIVGRDEDPVSYISSFPTSDRIQSDAPFRRRLMIFIRWRRF